MKIAWFCIPAHGHTNPTLALVRELTSAGHQVFYFSFEMFREKIEQAGAVFISCDGYDFEMEDKENADRVGKDKAFATELLVSSTLALDTMTTEKIREIRGLAPFTQTYIRRRTEIDYATYARYRGEYVMK